MDKGIWSSYCQYHQANWWFSSPAIQRDLATLHPYRNISITHTHPQLSWQNIVKILWLSFYDSILERCIIRWTHIPDVFIYFCMVKWYSIHACDWWYDKKGSVIAGTPFINRSILISAQISSNIHYNMWDEITYPFPNFNGCTFEI